MNQIAPSPDHLAPPCGVNHVWGGLLAAVALLGSAGTAWAQAAPAAPAVVAVPKTGAANLNITPRRVIFEGAKRTEAVYVFNQGNAAVTVDVALVDNIMLANGEIVPVANAAEKGAAARDPLARLHSARDLIVSTPSRMVLEPGKGKTVRLRAGLPDAAAGPGEYRTHLTVTSLPPPGSGVTAEAAAGGKGELAFTINTVFGISIPLIVRTAGVTASASFGAFALERGTVPSPDAPAGRPATFLVVPLKRAGTASLYGNIEVRSGSGKGGEPIGLIRGIGVYSEVDQRIARIPLSREPRKGEVLSVVFLGDDGKAASELARGSFTAP